MDITIIEVTGNEPVTLDEAKAHLRVGITEDDTYITSLITLAQEYCESFTRRSIISSTLMATLPAFPLRGQPVELFYPPLKLYTHEHRQ